MAGNPRGIVAAGHELTAQTAEAILRDGGNAFDAALAAMCTAFVAEPVLSSLGGGGFLLARTKDGQQGVFDFFAHTPREKRPADELDFHPALVDFGATQQEFHIGLGAVATPGVARGLFEIHRELGRMPMREIVGPAIAHAREGVRTTSFQAYILGIVEPIYVATESVRSVFGSSVEPDRPLREGEILRLPELADVLETMAIEGVDLFYRGEVGRTLATMCRGGGGSLTMEDLERYEVIRRSPLSLPYRDATLAINPPPSSGGILVALALELLGSVADLREMGFGSYRHLDLLALVMELTNKARVDAHAEGGDSNLDCDRMLDPEFLAIYREQVLGRAEALRGTTHLNVMDAAGNVATMTITNGEGCGHMIPGTGVMPNNMLGEEDLCPDGFHRWAPNQRMTSMMSPCILQRNGRTIASGSGGSNRIRIALLQLMLNLVDFDMDVERAVTSPRICNEDGRLSVEAGFEEGVVERLIERYPRHELWNDLNLYFGGAHTVERRGDHFDGAGDPRRGGVCVVVR